MTGYSSRAIPYCLHLPPPAAPQPSVPPIPEPIRQPPSAKDNPES